MTKVTTENRILRRPQLRSPHAGGSHELSVTSPERDQRTASASTSTDCTDLNPNPVVEKITQGDSPDSLSVSEKAEVMRKWIYSKCYKQVYSSMLIQYTPRVVGRNAKAISEVMKHLERMGRVETEERGAYLDGAHRKKVWRILDLISTPLDNTNDATPDGQLHDHNQDKQKELNIGDCQAADKNITTTCKEQFLAPTSERHERSLAPADAFPDAPRGLWDVPFF